MQSIFVLLLYYFVLLLDPFHVGFDQTVYSVVESGGSVEVCVNLTHPPGDISGGEVTVLVFHNDSSIYVPLNPTFASKQLSVIMLIIYSTFSSS